MTSCQPPRSSGTRSTASVAKSIRSASPSAPSSEASWSRSPVSAPTQSFSTREHSFASSIRSGSGAPATPSRARQSAVSSAADEERPEPWGTSPSKLEARGDELDAGGAELRDRAAHERAPAVRRLGRGERELVALAEVARLGLDAVAVEPGGGHRDAAVDRERQREPAVVVGVLADQVDAARAARPNRRQSSRPRPGGPGDDAARGGRRRGRSRAPAGDQPAERDADEQRDAGEAEAILVEPGLHRGGA